jgi:hypothetical protein
MYKVVNPRFAIIAVRRWAGNRRHRRESHQNQNQHQDRLFHNRLLMDYGGARRVKLPA